jgi:hypothetical protein
MLPGVGRGTATEQPGSVGAAAAREVVGYLLALRPIMSATTERRRAWIREVGLLIEEARTGDPITLSRRAGQLGHAQLTAFREARVTHSHLVPPASSYELHEAVAGWLDKHVQACETLVRAEQQRSLRPLREVQELLGDARRFSQQFNDQYGRLIAELRERVEAALSKRRGRGRGGRRARRRGGGIWALFGR